MTEQQWVTQSYTRSVTDEPQGMIDAAANRRRIMGSTLFGGNSNTNNNFSQTQNYSSTNNFSQTQSYAQTQPIPSLTNNSKTSTIPQPDWSIFQGEMSTTTIPDPVTLEFKVRETPIHSPERRLNVGPNIQMQQLREELNRETRQFANKAKRIGSD